jgi:polyhydroxybutyrate depolymerase
VFALSPFASAATAGELRTFEHQGIGRSYQIHNAQAGKSQPAVIGLHGFRAPDQQITGEGQLDRIVWGKLEQLAPKAGFVTVYPGAIDGRWNYMAGLPKAVRAGDTIADDAGFIARLIERLIAEKIADRDRIYLAGFSRGALMAFEMLCRHADIFAAAFAMAGQMMEAQRHACKPARAVPVAAIAGTADRSLPYDGWVLPNGRLLSVPETMDFWRRQHGCTTQSDKSLPASERSQSRVRLIVWGGCKQPDSVRLYRIEGGGHQAPSDEDSPPRWIKTFGIRNHDIEAAEEVWRFVSRFKR